jgi:L-ribulokinase
MTGLKDVIYKPTRSARATYNKLYKLYLKLHDQFGGMRGGSLGAVMKKLLEIKEAAGR